MFGAVIADWRRYAALVEVSGALYATLADVIKAGQEKGKFRAGGTKDLALAAWSLVHGLALLISAKRVGGIDDALSVERVSQGVTALLIDGLAVK